MGRIWLFIFVVPMLTLISFAQSTDRFEVFGGFSDVAPDFTGIGSSGPGWNLAGSVRALRFLRVVGDFSGFYPTGSGGANATYHMFMGGPELAVRVGTYQPFAHVLLGDTKGSLTYGDSQFGGDFDHFTAGIGGGVDLGFNRWGAIRVGADWLHVGGQFLSSNNMARISTGLVVRF
jgi:hypothetical protein